ncbi:MAG: Rieske 2Fe-2S domain-containing protein [Candidatus Dormibacteraeota bacterium]|nr:Rieske 2Fe-2S domain-containing protein [Candidatus Dormibacteraeota bacterium]
MTTARERRAPEPNVLGSIDDFPEGSQRVVRLGAREIGVFNIRGRLYGLPNVCPHQAGPLCEGRRVPGTTTARAEGGWRTEWGLEGEVISCPWHGLEYHIPTGQCLAFPEIRLRTYQVEARDGEVVVLV